MQELQNQNTKNLQTNTKRQKPILTKDNSVNKLNFELISRKYLEELQLIRLLINYGSTQQIIINDSKITVAEFIILELEKDSKDINSAFSVPLFNKILNVIIHKPEPRIDSYKHSLTHLNCYTLTGYIKLLHPLYESVRVIKNGYLILHLIYRSTHYYITPKGGMAHAGVYVYYIINVFFHLL